MFAGELAANASLRAEIRLAIEAGLPVYAECGGLMYLCRRITWGDRSAEMVGALPFEVEMTDHPQGHGYVEAAVVAENPFLPLGTRLRGHEFHHSRLSGEAGGLATAYALTRGQGLDGRRDGLLYRNVLAAYLHLHADGVPAWAEGIVAQARGRYGS
jgi:cobyrinic acid a,c-diamide synthase